MKSQGIPNTEEKKKHKEEKRGTKRSQNILMECKLDKPSRFVSSILTSAPMILGLLTLERKGNNPMTEQWVPKRGFK